MRNSDQIAELAQTIQVAPAREPLPSEQRGVVVARQHPTGWFISARYRPSLSAAEIDEFASFTEMQAHLLLESGPQDPSWQPDASGRWLAYYGRTAPTQREHVAA
jgi:hypothetical protein